MSVPLAPHATRLAKRIKSWHALERDPLPFAQCQHLVAALFGYANWGSLQVAAREETATERGAFRVERLKHFGYTAEAGERLISYLVLDDRPPSEDADPAAATYSGERGAPGATDDIGVAGELDEPGDENEPPEAGRSA